jgi:hypothetical protein
VGIGIGGQQIVLDTGGVASQHPGRVVHLSDRH